MKKNTKLRTGESKQRQHGPLKEKAQITVRIDKQLADEAYAQAKDDNMRITDIVERGVYLALKERDHDMPRYNKEVRFMVANATREQQITIRGLLIALMEPEVERLEPDVVIYSKEVPIIWAFCKAFLESRNKVAHAGKCLELYSRYGKTAEEIAELGNL